MTHRYSAREKIHVKMVEVVQHHTTMEFAMIFRYSNVRSFKRHLNMVSSSRLWWLLMTLHIKIIIFFRFSRYITEIDKVFLRWIFFFTLVAMNESCFGNKHFCPCKQFTNWKFLANVFFFLTLQKQFFFQFFRLLFVVVVVLSIFLRRPQCLCMSLKLLFPSEVEVELICLVNNSISIAPKLGSLLIFQLYIFWWCLRHTAQSKADISITCSIGIFRTVKIILIFNDV